MKISNNALNFLLAQYRAIFKRAYVKGIASAVLLTAGLAAGQAQAAVATLDGTTLTLPTSGQTAVIDGDSGTTAGQYNKGEAHFTNVAIYGGDLKWDGALVIESGKALQVNNSGNNRILGGDTNVNISGDGSLTIAINRTGDASTDGLKIAGNSKDVTVDIGTINVQNGLLEITDKAETNSGTTTVSAASIIVGTEAGKSEAYLNLTSAGSDKNAILGRSGSANETASEITVYGDGLLTVGTTDGAGTKIYGAELNLLGGANMITNAGADTENLEQVDHLVVDAKSFKVIDGNGSGATFSGTTAEIAGNVLIGSGASWVLATKDKVVDKQTIKANVAFESGSNVQIGGTLTVSGGKLTVDENAGLFATQATGSTIKVTKNGEDSGTLVIGVESLQKFLNGGQEYTAIVEDPENAGKYKLDAKADPKPKSESGAVLVTNGILQLVSDKQIDLANDKVLNISGGTAASEGKIVISGSTIVADDVLVSEKITDLSAATHNVSLKVNDLTLGDANNSTPVADYGFKSATTHNLTVLAKDGPFSLPHDITLHATSRDVMLDGNEVEVAEDGSITGDLKVTGTAHLTVDAGHYTTRDDITIDNGYLNITSTSQEEADDGTYPNGLDAGLTIKAGGNFTIDHTSAEVNITGSAGAEAYLDLRDANSVKWGSGSITVSGTLGAVSSDPNVDQVGQGTLYITGSQFEQYLDTTAAPGNASKTTISLDDNGVLFVDGSTTSLEYDVSDFGTSADSGTVAFTGKGTFETDTALTLEIASGATDQFLAIGSGTIKAPTIRLENNVEDATEFVVSGGTLEVASGLTSNVGMVSFESNSTSGGILNLDGQGSVGVDVTFSGSNSALNVQSGRWTAQNAYFEASSALNIEDGASLELDNINVTGTGVSGDVGVGSSLTVDTIQTAADTNFTIADKAIMTINGRNDIVETGDNADIDAVVDNADTAGINLAGATFNVNGAEAQLKIGSAAVSKLVTFEPAAGNTGVQELVVDAALQADYNLTGYATLYLDFAQDVSLTAANARELKNQLFAPDGDVGQGIINVGSGSLDIVWTDRNSLTTTWENVKDFAEIESVTSEELQRALITNVTGTVAGHYGAMQVDADKALSVDGNLGLHAARDGYFVFSQSGETKTAEDVVIQGGSLLLGGAGKIGAISAGGHDVTIAPSTLEGAVAGTTEVLGAITNAGTLDISNETTVAGDVSADTLELADDTSLTNSTYSMTLGSAQVGANASLGTTNLTLNDVAGESWIEGTVDVASKLTVSAGDVTIANGTVSAQATELASGVTFQVGQDAAADQDDPATSDFNEAESFSGTFETTTLALNGATFIVDPEYGLPTALASIRNFADASDAQYTDESKVGTADGSIFVGQNSALGIGTENAAELAQVIAKYQSNGSLSNAEDRLGAVVYLDGIATIGDTQSLVMTNKSVEDFITYYNGANGTQTDFADQATDPTSVFTNTIYFGDGTALMANAAAIKDAYDQGTALVTFAGQNGKLVADGGEVLITGDLRGNTKYTLFADKGGTGDANGTLVNVYDVTGTAVEAGKGIAVTTENGFLVGEINNENGGVVTLGLAGDARARMSGASDPVYDTLVAYFNGYNGVKTTDPDTGADTTDYLYKKLDPQTNQTTGEVTYTKDTNYSNYFLAGALAQGNGSAAEAAARMGVYGGAPQAAIKAGQSSTDTIAARFGIGSAISNLTVAGNTQGAALWLAPVYKTSDSDGFDAQGVDYGVNVDLYGVALGADYTLANGISFGAMFNVGSGEVDGEGAASPVSNDFDYYGFGAYAGYTMGQFSVVGDISYTVADNEVEASTSVDHIGAQMDSTNLSVGVTGKYELSFNGVNVTPHVGLRYSNIDLDEYTIDGNEVVASADSDKLNLFSIPVGVTIAKEFKGESWTVAPSFDLTLTGQFGDDELDGSVSWAGVSNLTTDTTTEVFDNFTYGATLGVEAQSVGGVALGINVGYTGSSNVDEFGVNANARFVF